MRFVVLIAIGLFWSALANAELVRYSYFGADASTFTGTRTGDIQNPDYDPNSGDDPYDYPHPIGVPSDLRVTGWFEVDGGLGSNLNNVDVTSLVSDFAFEELFGANTVANEPFSKESMGQDYAGFGGAYSFFVSTDEFGNISGWDIALDSYLPDPNHLLGGHLLDYDLTYLAGGIANGESLSWADTATSWYAAYYVVTEYDSAQVGSWSASVVPVPPALWLMASALLVLYRRTS